MTTNQAAEPCRITYLGHATVLVEMNGLRLLTDPLLVHFIGPIKRQVPLPDLEALQLDAILVSHLHGDHFDLASLKKLGRETRLIVPTGAGPFLKLRSFSQVEEIAQGETITLGEVKITATRADHGGRRLPWVPQVDPLGFVLDGAREIYFAGDTDLFPEMTDIGLDLDLALLPVWGWGPTLGEGHMDPLRAAQALGHLRARMAVPIHWGTYCPVILDWFRPRFLTRPPLDFAEHVAALSPEVTVRVLDPLQSMELG